MITIGSYVIAFLAGVAATYWYIHRKNPDLAQKVSDTVKEAATEDVKKVQEQVQTAIEDVKKD